MEYHRQSHGRKTTLEQLWLPLNLAVSASAAHFLIPLLTGPPASRWLLVFTAACAFSVTGALLILRAKLPVYGQRRFFTFGPGALPTNRLTAYRWGWILVLGGAGWLCWLSLAR